MPDQQDIIASAISNQLPSDGRIPVVALLGQSLAQANEGALKSLNGQIAMETVVFSDQPVPANWPVSLRHIAVASDELAQARGCLCCSMRSELARELSALFLKVLRRQMPRVSLIVIVTNSLDSDALELTLRHAPFLGQRFRFAASLPPAQA
jgi:hypothetical protein